MVDELVVEVCDGGRRVVLLDRVVTEDLARTWRDAGPVSGSRPVLAPEATRREVGTPEEVVGLAAGNPGVDARLEMEAWRMEAARVGRPGGDGSGAGLLVFSRCCEDVEAIRANTPDSGRLLLVEAALVVALLVMRVVALTAAPDGCPLIGNLLGEALRSSPLLLVVSGLLLGLRSERARDNALVDVADAIVADVNANSNFNVNVNIVTMMDPTTSWLG